MNNFYYGVPVAGGAVPVVAATGGSTSCCSCWTCCGCIVWVLAGIGFLTFLGYLIAR